MSPRRPDPATRLTLVDTAARLLADEGPRALTTRRIAAETGNSTMSVYTYFGGMSGLVREIVREGFSRLQANLTRVTRTDDPVADMALLGRAYRHNALTNPHLFAVMFGGSSLAGFALSEDDRQHGRYTLSNVAECAGRCIAAGRFGQPAEGGGNAAGAEVVAHQMWFATHGLVTLELGEYLVKPFDGERLFEIQLVGLMVGVGDTPSTATRSVALSRQRFEEEILSA